MRSLPIHHPLHHCMPVHQPVHSSCPEPSQPKSTSYVLRHPNTSTNPLPLTSTYRHLSSSSDSQVCASFKNSFNHHVLSCPWRFVGGGRLVWLCPRRPFPAACLSLSLKWKRLLRDPVRAPHSLSCPEEASASKLAQEGFLFLWAVLSCLVPVCLSPVGCPVHVCLALCGLSCHVLSCLSSPGGLLIPPSCPMEFFFFFWGGVEGFWLECTKHHLPWPPELPAPPWPPVLSVPRPVFLSVCVLRGLQSAHNIYIYICVYIYISFFFLVILFIMNRLRNNKKADV